MTRFVSALSLICLCWTLLHQFGASLGYMDPATAETPDSIAVSQHAVSFSGIGETITLIATVFDAERNVLTDAPLIWTVANPAVATVNQNGLVTAVSNGFTRIALTAGTVSVKVTVLVGSDRGSLVKLYDATGGTNWNQNSNWRSNHPLDTWHGVTTNAQGFVTALLLNDNNLVGPIPAELGSFSELTRLDLSSNRLSGSLPTALGDLNNLSILDLSDNDIMGSIPSSLLNLPLTMFGWEDNDGLCMPNSEKFVTWIEKMVSHTGDNYCNREDRDILEAFYTAVGGIGWTNSGQWNVSTVVSSWFGITTDTLGRVTAIDLSDNNLIGELPGSVGNLTGLVTLNLSKNQLYGPLPSELAGLSVLHTLSIADNAGLSGEVPASFANLGSLRVFQADGTNVCLPTNPLLQSWNNRLTTSSVSPCDVPMDPALELSVSSLHITEGNSNSYTVQLVSQPTGTVTVAITGHDNTDLILDQTSLEFTITTWGTAQTVTVDADQDDDTDEDKAILVHTASGADYGGVSGNVEVTVTDDDTPELMLSASSLTIDEGNSESYTVKLASQPSETVTVAITGHDNTDLTLDQTSLEFTTTTWSAAQTVTVDADQDDDTDEDKATLAHTASGADYGGISEDVEVTITDDDTPALVLSVSSLTIDEGSSESYTVKLASQPSETVTVAITGYDNTDLILDQTGLEFTTTTWSTAQMVAVDADQDDDTDDDKATLVHTASGADYGGVSENVKVTITDDDAAELVLSVSSLAVGEGSNESYTVKLASPPTTSVRVSISKSNPNSDLTLSDTGLIFTDNNTIHTVTVTAHQDVDWTSDIEHLTHQASGGNYQGVSADILVAVDDDETPPSPPHAYVSQGVQSFFNPVQLIAGEPALLRVFPTANATTSTRLPRAVATFYLTSNNLEESISIAAKDSPIPTEVWPQGLGLSLNADIPANMIQPGLEVVIEVDPDGTVPNSLGVAKRIPDTGRLSLDVVTVPTFNIVFLPIVTTGDVGGDSVVPIAQRMAASPNTDALLYLVRTLLPINDISATAPIVVTVDTKDASDLLQVVAAARALAGGSGYWMGLHNNPDGALGIAQISGFLSLSTPNPWVIAHELGHNLSLDHAPCGRDITRIDANYPYSDGSIGSWGYENGSMHSPDTYFDLMSYCGPFWISDYHFDKANSYLSSSKFSISKDPPLASKSSDISLLLWGGTDAASRPFLEPVFKVDAAPSLPEAPGPWQLVGHVENGDELFHLTFTLPTIADGDGSSSFAFVIPLRQEQGGLLDSVTLSGPNGSFTIDGEHDDPMAIVIDQASGQVTGFLNNYDPSDQSRIAAIGNKVGGTEQRVLFSRGIPDLGVQN